MLGVTRIYSRKVQYLLDDCKETRERITLVSSILRSVLATQSCWDGDSKDATDVSWYRHSDLVLSICQRIRFELARTRSPFLMSATISTSLTGTSPPLRNPVPQADDLRSWVPPPADIAPRGLHTAPAAQINLRPAQREYGAYNFGRPAAPSIYGGSTTSRHSSPDLHDSNSQDFSGIDLNLRLEDFGAGDDSVEIGRDAQPGLSREGSVRSGFEKRGGSLDVPEGMAEFEPMDLGLDFGELEQPVPNLEERSRRECQ